MATRTRRARAKKKKKSNKPFIPKYRFRVISGRHYERVDVPGKKKRIQEVFTAGMVFESFRRLDKIFGNKLRYLGLSKEEPEVDEVEEDAPDTEEERVDSDEDEDEDAEEEEDEEEDNDDDEVDGADDEEDDDDEDSNVVQYRMKHRGGGRWWVVPCNTVTGDIVGEPVHDGYLTREAAIKLLEDMES